MDAHDIASTLPPHARIDSFAFASDDALRVALVDRPEEIVLSPGGVQALLGCSLLEEIARTDPISPMLSLVTTASWPRALRPHTHTTKPSTQDTAFVLAVEAQTVDALWYLVADSFNFRRSLGAQAGYATETNLRALVGRLMTFAPRADVDAFVMAMHKRSALPAPMSSLAEFFRYVEKRRAKAR